jgi:hypothetical protein
MSVTRPRGPLPARVYWFRRLLVLALAFGLVLGISRLFGGDGSQAPDPAAQPASGVATADATPSAVATSGAVPRGTERPDSGKVGKDRPGKNKPGKKKAGKRAPRPLPMPTGPCRDDDVKIVPTLRENAYAGEDVRLALRLSTYRSPACSWEVSADTVAVRLTSGSDRIWSSQDCPAAVPTEAVVLRKRKATRVDVIWSGRRSDSDCSRSTSWAQPGYYHVAAAAMGSEPESEQFELRSPAPITITPTPTPTPKDDAGTGGPQT